MSVRIITGDCREVLPTLPADSFDCVVTSPPYWGLRDYGVEGQIGLESTLAEYLGTMVGVFRELRRVLKPSGTCWLNIGDSYAGGGRGDGSPGCKQRSNVGSLVPPSRDKSLKPKDLCMIPNRLALLLQDDGWYVRSEIIWHKPNPMPESVLDRPTCSHEKVWLLTKSAQYFYDGDAIVEISAYPGDNRALRTDSHKIAEPMCADGGSRARTGKPTGETRNARNVWTIPSEPYRGAHYAVMPSALAERCIMAGCPERLCQHCGAPHVRKTERESISLRPNSDSIRGNSPSSGRANGSNPQRGSVGVRVKSMGFEPSCSCFDVFVAGSVLDPFGGAGTTGLVADRLGRHATLIELNPTNREMAADRVTMDGPLFAEVTT